MLKSSLLLSTLVLAAGSASAAPTSTAPSPSTAPKALGQLYSFEVTIRGIDADPNTFATYSFVLPERAHASLSSDDNVPISSAANGPAMRENVGVKLDATFEQQGKLLMLDGNVEISSVDPASPAGARVVHRVRAHDMAPITPDTPSLFASIYDITTHRHYEVTVLAKKWQ